MATCIVLSKFRRNILMQMKKWLFALDLQEIIDSSLHTYQKAIAVVTTRLLTEVRITLVTYLGVLPCKGVHPQKVHTRRFCGKFQNIDPKKKNQCRIMCCFRIGTSWVKNSRHAQKTGSWYGLRALFNISDEHHRPSSPFPQVIYPQCGLFSFQPEYSQKIPKQPN